MSLTETFNPATAGQVYLKPAAKPKKKRPAPFCLRLSVEDRARLAMEAAGAPLGAYIKAKVLGDAVPVRTRRTGLAVENRTALAQVLALLGRAHLTSNLNQLAHATSIGALPMTQETEAELFAALHDVRDLRRLLLAALGLKPEATA